MKKLIIFILSVLILSNLSYLNIINAEEINLTGLVIYPALLTTKIAPGNTLDESFNVKNNLKYDALINLKVENGLASKSTLPVYKWITLKGDNNLKISNHEVKSIPYSINVPDGIPNGIYKAIILVELKGSQDQNNFTGTNIDQLIAYQITLVVNNSAFINSLKFNSFDLSNIVIDSQNFNISLSNTNPYVISKPLVYLHILNNSGSIVYETVLNPNLNSIEGSDNLILNNSYNLIFNKLFDIGKYRAEVLGVDTISNVATTSNKEFYFIPKEIIFLFVVLLILIILLSIFFISKIRSRIKTPIK